MKKYLLVIGLVFWLTFALYGCSNSNPASDSTESKSQEVPNLVGEWKESETEPGDMYHIATITESTIEIYWYTEEDSTKALYWAGTFEPPTTSGPYSWVSNNDVNQTESAILASSSPTKEFTFKDGIISYEASALGITTTIKLEKLN